MPNARIFKQALANTIKFVPEGYVPDARYNSIPFDSGLFSEQFRAWENSSNYNVKLQQNDNIFIQIHANTTVFDGCPGTGIELYVYDCRNKRLIKPTAGTPTSNHSFQIQEVMYEYAGNTHMDSGVNYQLYTIDFQMTMANLGLPDGKYYFVARAYFGVNDYDQYISEPFLLQQRHYNTILIEFTHPRSQYQTIFGNSSRVFSTRVEGMIGNLDLESSDTQYNDQEYDMRMLNAYPYRVWNLRIGHVSGIPEWLWDRVHIALGCKTISIEGVPYTKNEGAEWEKTVMSRRIRATIQLREPENYAGTTFVGRPPVTVMILPDQFPYAVFTIDLNFPPVGIKSTPYMPIYYQGDVNKLLDWLNNNFGGTLNAVPRIFRGEFKQKGNRVVYENAPGEGYDSSLFTTKILSKVVRIHTEPQPSFRFYHYSYGTVVAWGDGSANGYSPTGTGTSVTETHNYPSGGVNFVDVFHFDTFDNLQPKYSPITGISGTTPVNMAILSVQNSAITSVNLGDVLGTRTTNLTLVEYKNNPYLKYVWGISGRVWSKITGFNFSNNAMESSAVDSLLNEVWQMGINYPSQQSRNITVWVNNNAAPTFLVWAKINQMRSWGWQIFHD